MENIIALIRKRFNLTQDELSARLGISREYVNKMENGKMAISHKTKAKINEYFNDAEVNNISRGNIT